MPDRINTVSLDQQIGEWRSYLQRRQAIHAVDVAELEDHLREQVATLTRAGLSNDEAFLVAVKRMGDLDSLSREFALEHSERLWKQLVITASDDGIRAQSRKDAMVAFALAIAAAVAVKLPALFGLNMHTQGEIYFRNAAFFVLPLLTAYFAWKRRLPTRTVTWLILGFVLAAVFANIYPFAPRANTEVLTILHVPIALWLVIGIAYTGGRWSQVSGRMDFIRFSGELFIYYVLIALGGGVFTAFLAMIFHAIGINPAGFLDMWLLPCGAAGAVLVASWLAEAKQSVIENMAPVLTRLFTPLFTALLLTFLGTVLWTGRGVDIQRDVLIAFDLLLVVVLCLVLYNISARDQQSPSGIFDVLQFILLVSALLTDAVALWAIAGRISEFGFTPNRVAALGENIILLINLTWSAALYLKFVQGRGPFTALERWQTDYLPVYAAWAALVVAVFPPLFRYI
jgi:hypothetical protein